MTEQVKPLTSANGPLVWIDCEMTGLNPEKDKILEIAVLITDGDLNIVDKGIEYIIKTDKSLLDGCAFWFFSRKGRNSFYFSPSMDAWCTKQHGDSGLTKACIESPHTRESVSQSVLTYIKNWIPEQRTACLAGNSVHADRSFLVKEMPEVIDWLHYRIVGEIEHFSSFLGTDLLNANQPMQMCLQSRNAYVGGTRHHPREYRNTRAIIGVLVFDPLGATQSKYISIQRFIRHKRINTRYA
ncbi:Phosphatidylinositol 3,4,5-trisphosphate-dependent Rac exchanger 2 protein [Stygiomarasmius scandens]|uniref:Phosphatidylinositol 3,4,5-trisphosphate-dependent Rac exchanger 2 protein n=1 Tax=Marasmiellus scandens TaxID=2682957 RepID=A0ABR1KA66_9AGAR